VGKNRSLVIFLVLLSALCGLAWFYTGSFAPPSGDTSIWFYGGLFALLVAKFVTEYRFSKPNDSIVNCVAAFVAISTLSSPPYKEWWELLRWLAFACATVALLVAWDLRRTPSEAHGLLRALAYRVVTRLGSAEVLFSLVFVLAVLSYRDASTESTRAFVILWGVILLAANLDLGLSASGLAARTRFKGREALGATHSFLSPSIVYCTRFDSERIAAHELVGFAPSVRSSPTCYGIVIDERASAEETLVSVALLNTSVGDACLSGRSLMIRLNESDKEQANRELSPNHAEDLKKVVGTVASGTNISQVKFEVFGSPAIGAGSLLGVPSGERTVFYQVFGGVISEEATLRQSNRAFVEGEAEQVGFWDAQRGGFETHDWVANQRSLVRLVDQAFAPPAYNLKPDEMRLGTIPSSLYPVNVCLEDIVLYHTSILGVTGAGKSFLAYDLIESSAQRGVKVVCIDPTGDYQRHLEDAVVINGSASLKAFLNSSDHRIAILETSGQGQHPIEQTRAVAKGCLAWCETDRTDEDVLHPRAKVLIVLEEAHLLIPEWNFNPQRNLQDTVSATSQVVLQARKYGLGFLVISQRTANVVKSILNQCNTVISFQAFDETGFDFLRNYMGSYHVRSLPNLKPRHGILVGKASLSRRPLMVRFRDQTRKLRDEPATPMPVQEESEGVQTATGSS
jgi:hypothetical protein